jgi:hypothetical protein
LILENHDYDRLLKFFNEKSILKRISKFTGQKDGEFEVLVLNLLDTEKKEMIFRVLKKQIPSLT